MVSKTKHSSCFAPRCPTTLLFVCPFTWTPLCKVHLETNSFLVFICGSSYTLDFSCVSTCLFIKWTPEQGLYPSLSPRPMWWTTGILLCGAPRLLETSLCTPFRKLPLLISNMGLWWEQPITIFHPWPQWLVQTYACDSGWANQIASLRFFSNRAGREEFCCFVVHSSTATIPAS